MHGDTVTLASAGARCLDCGRPAVKTTTWTSGATSWCAEHASFPSARALLEEGCAVRPYDHHAKGAWSVYAELDAYDGAPTGVYTVYPGDEGPHDGLTLDEALDEVGGDTVVFLAPAGRVRWTSLDEQTRARLLRGECRPASASTECHALDDARVLDAAAAVLSARGRTSLAASLREECHSVLRELL